MFILSFVRSHILVALLVLGAVLSVAAACGSDGGQMPVGETPVADGTPTGGGATAEIRMVPRIRFDRAELTIAADTETTITAENTDAGVSHNFAVYASRHAAESGEEALAATEVCNAPCSDAVTLKLSAGEYFFRCEVHPNHMTGTLIVR
jgi:plastocyanin